MAVDTAPIDNLKAVNAATEAAYDVFKNGGNEKEAMSAASDAVGAIISSQHDEGSPVDGKKLIIDYKLVIQATNLAKLACADNVDTEQMSGEDENNHRSNYVPALSLSRSEVMSVSSSVRSPGTTGGLSRNFSDDDFQSRTESQTGGGCGILSMFADLGRDLRTWNNDERLIEYIPGVQSISSADYTYPSQRSRTFGTTLYTVGSEDISLRTFSTFGDNSVAYSTGMASPVASRRTRKDRFHQGNSRFHQPRRISEKVDEQESFGEYEDTIHEDDTFGETGKIRSVTLPRMDKDAFDIDLGSFTKSGLDVDVASKSSDGGESTEVIVVATGKCIEATINENEEHVEPINTALSSNMHSLEEKIPQSCRSIGSTVCRHDDSHGDKYFIASSASKCAVDGVDHLLSSPAGAPIESKEWEEWFESKNLGSQGLPTALQSVAEKPSESQEIETVLTSVVENDSTENTSSQPCLGAAASEEPIEVRASFSRDSDEELANKENAKSAAVEDERDDTGVSSRGALTVTTSSQDKSEQTVSEDNLQKQTLSPEQTPLYSCDRPDLKFNPSEMSDANYTTLVDFVVNDLSHTRASDNSGASITKQSSNDSADHTILSGTSTSTMKSRSSLVSRVKGMRNTRGTRLPRSPPSSLRRLKRSFARKKGNPEEPVDQE